jgi:hypothetical protein
MEALAAEFASEVAFHPAPPSNITAPAVFVVPGDPFLEPDSQGVVRERWDVWVAVSLKSADRGAAEMRDLTHRVVRTVHSLGAVWRSSSGPRRLADPNTQQIVSVSRVDFKYQPPQLEATP